MKNYSKNKKLNYVLNDIRESLEDLGIEEVKHYYDEFKGLSDYNIVQYGNARVYYDDIREMYKNAGYKTIDSFSDTKLWETYKRQVGYVARVMLEEKECTK